MAIRKKSKAKVTAAKVTASAEPAVTIAADQPDVEIIDDTPDDAPANGVTVTADAARLKAATEQLGDIFDSIQKRRLEELDRRKEALQALSATANDKDFKAIVDRSDPGKLTRLSEAAADSTKRLTAVAEERSALIESMARARQAMGVKQARRRAVGK